MKKHTPTTTETTPVEKPVYDPLKTGVFVLELTTEKVEEVIDEVLFWEFAIDNDNEDDDDVEQ